MNFSNLNDGIVIFSDTGSVMFSSTGSIIENKKTLRKHKLKKNIIHEVFDNMIKYTDNEYWETFLSKCSRNIFPDKNFKFVNNILYYKIKSKKHRDEIYIDSEKLEESFIKLKLFLRTKGIISKADIDIENVFFEQDVVEINQWKDIQKERKYEKLIEHINKLKEEYNLDFKEVKQTESLIKVAVSGNILNNNNIIVEDNNIKEIKNLIWLDEERRFKIDIDKINLKFTKSKTKDTNNYYYCNSNTNDNSICREVECLDIGKKWEKFLENFYNKR